MTLKVVGIVQAKPELIDTVCVIAQPGKRVEEANSENRQFRC